MPGPEVRIERYLVQRVRDLGGQCIKFVPVVAGVPDRLVLLPGGRIRLVETKAPGGRLRPDQRVWHARAARLGIEVAVLYSREQVDAWVGQFDVTDPT